MLEIENKSYMHKCNFALKIGRKTGNFTCTGTILPNFTCTEQILHASVHVKTLISSTDAGYHKRRGGESLTKVIMQTPALTSHILIVLSRDPDIKNGPER